MNRTGRALLFVLCAGSALAALFAAPALAEAPASLMKVSATAEPPRGAPGAHFTLRIEGTLQAGWHVNSHTPSEDYLIPTSVELGPAAGVTFSPPAYPAGESKKFSFSQTPLSVYEGSLTILVEGRVDDRAAPGERTLAGKLAFQPCSTTQCLAPASVAFAAPFVVTPAAPAATGAAGGFDFGERGLAATFLLLFLGGLALNLTPCVYPIIPITVGFFGGQSREESGRPIALATLYVLGMSFTYSALGVAAALSGKLFGSALQSPWILGGIAAVLVALALSMFGLYEIQPPRALMNRAGARTGRAGAFGMGLLVGVVAAPCLGPFVLGLLTYVAARHDPVLGFAMFFVLSLGLGLPYLFLAAFSGTISKLPRAGEWMVEIKKIFGFVLLAMAAYFGQILLPDPLHRWLLPGVLAAGGLYVLARLFSRRFPGFTRLAAFGGALLLLGAAGYFAPGPAGGRPLSFQRYDAQTVAGTGRPAMIDFSADWCIPCHELDEVTFADPRVRQRLSAYALFRADMTRQDSAEAMALAQKFGIQGMPTIVFLDSNGKEIPGSRLVGYEPPEAFLRRLVRLAPAAG
jgi:thiol:disulfide interchange protein DsbD